MHCTLSNQLMDGHLNTPGNNDCLHKYNVDYILFIITVNKRPLISQHLILSIFQSLQSYSASMSGSKGGKASGGTSKGGKSDASTGKAGKGSGSASVSMSSSTGKAGKGGDDGKAGKGSSSVSMSSSPGKAGKGGDGKAGKGSASVSMSS